jgi:hypothetical protein
MRLVRFKWDIFGSGNDTFGWQFPSSNILRAMAIYIDFVAKWKQFLLHISVGISVNDNLRHANKFHLFLFLVACHP